MTPESTLLRDLTVIMAVAGGVTLFFRWLRQPPVVGYLLAGFLIGPYSPPAPSPWQGEGVVDSGDTPFG